MELEKLPNNALCLIDRYLVNDYSQNNKYSSNKKVSNLNLISKTVKDALIPRPIDIAYIAKQYTQNVKAYYEFLACSFATPHFKWVTFLKFKTLTIVIFIDIYDTVTGNQHKTELYYVGISSKTTYDSVEFKSKTISQCSEEIGDFAAKYIEEVVRYKGLDPRDILCMDFQLVNTSSKLRDGVNDRPQDELEFELSTYNDDELMSLLKKHFNRLQTSKVIKGHRAKDYFHRIQDANNLSYLYFHAYYLLKHETDLNMIWVIPNEQPTNKHRKANEGCHFYYKKIMYHLYEDKKKVDEEDWPLQYIWKNDRFYNISKLEWEPENYLVYCSNMFVL